MIKMKPTLAALAHARSCRGTYTSDAALAIGFELAKRFPDGTIPESFRYHRLSWWHRLKLRFFPTRYSDGTYTNWLDEKLS